MNDPIAAGLPSGGELPPLAVGTPGANALRETVQITTAGGIVEADLYHGVLAERVPGVLMLAPDRAAWADLAARLQASGFTVLSASVAPGSAARGVGDFASVLQALIQVETVDPARMVVIGAEDGADLALLGCAGDLLCDGIALLTPIDGQTVAPAAARYDRPLLLIAAAGDAAYATAGLIAATTRADTTFETRAGAARGAALLSDPALADLLTDWLRTQTG